MSNNRVQSARKAESLALWNFIYSFIYLFICKTETDFNLIEKVFFVIQFHYSLFFLEPWSNLINFEGTFPYEFQLESASEWNITRQLTFQEL